MTTKTTPTIQTLTRTGNVLSSDPRPVLVITADNDPTADYVISELGERGVPIARFDAADFPHTVEMTANFGDSGLTGHLVTSSRSVNLEEVRALYYRRPASFSFAHLDSQDARFATAQARYGFGGVLANLPGCLYVNHPHRIADAEFKPAQLATAVAVGLSIPPTIITNDPMRARDFVAAVDRAVYKPLWSTPYATRDVAKTVWVREVKAGELDERVAGTAHLFQQCVAKVADLRVTVIGEKVFGVRIESSDGLLDWRYDYNQLTYAAAELPPALVTAMHAYLARFNLVFGCFDFALTATGGIVFLECNPNGQWAWMSEPTGLPMTAALADLLEKGADE